MPNRELHHDLPQTLKHIVHFQKTITQCLFGNLLLCQVKRGLADIFP